MDRRIVLASGSAARRKMLEAAHVPHDVRIARVDEEMIRLGGIAAGAAPRDIADTLAEHKAVSVSRRNPGELVLGADQLLVHEGEILSKPADLDAAAARLRRLRGSTHELVTAAVIARDGEAIWRHVAVPRLTMRPFSDTYLARYLARNGPALCQSVGAYMIEGEGIRLIERVEGDIFTIQGLPLMPLLRYLTDIGHLEG